MKKEHHYIRGKMRKSADDKIDDLDQTTLNKIADLKQQGFNSEMIAEKLKIGLQTINHYYPKANYKIYVN
jgi:hypothetical protein